MEKVFHPDGGWALEQAPQGSDHSTKPDRVQGVFGQHSQAHVLIVGGSWGRSWTQWSWWTSSNSTYSMILWTFCTKLLENTLKLFMITQKTLWANARREAAHKIPKLVMSQSNKMSHIHVWSKMPGFFRLFCNLWENMVVLKLSGEVLQDCWRK